MDCLVSTREGATEVKIGEAEEGSSSGSKGVFMFDKKIEFHLARKPYTGFSSVNNGGDFRVETLNPDSGRKRFLGSDIPGKKVDTFDFLESGLDPEFTLSISFKKIGAGLENLGNTCFLNSVLQCLTYTEPLVAYLQSGKHQNSCRVAGFCALCAIQKHVSRALQSTGRSLIPRDLVSNLRCISQNFRNARQEDAHEYMVNLLESMHKCCLPSGVPSESPAAYEKSLVHKIFGGRLCSQVQCQQCSYCSNKYDPFLDLSLEIVKADSLPVALRNFTAAEMLDGGEKHYQCQQCKQKVKAKKRLTVYKAPSVLAIHLKRFHPLDPCRKVDKKVSFDRSLDMKPFVSGPYEGDLKYSLYGVLVHSGPSTRSGHYVCYVRTSSGMWYLLNDNEVRQVGENTVLGQKAYMLFYVRDRKNVAPKRPCHVPQMEDKKTTVDGNIANLAVKKFSKEHVENGSVGNVSRPDSSVESKKHAFGTAKVPLSGTSQQQDHGLTVPKVYPLLQPSSSVPLPQDLSKVVSFPNQVLKEHFLCPALPVDGNGGTTKLENSVNTAGTKTMESNKMSTCSDLQNCAIEKLATVENSPKNVPIFNMVGPSEVLPGYSVDKPIGRGPCLVLCGDSVDKAVNEVDPVKLPTKSSCQNSQGSGICNEAAGGESLSNNSGTRGQEIVHELMKSSLPAVILNECLHSEAADIKPSKKLKKKLLRKKILKIHVGLKFLPALSLRKKKHKKNKRCTSHIDNLIKEHLMDKTLLSRDVGLSTSNHSNILSSTSHSRKGFESGLRKGDDLIICNGNALTIATDGEFSDRDTQSCAVLATGEQVKSGISFSEPRELGCTNNREVDASQCGMMRIVTTSQEEVTVARWDGIGLAPPGDMEANAVENCSIGYIPDEWDEEYDRGKRKKFRQSQHEFGGPNLFQEIAAKKSSKIHQTKRNRSFPPKPSRHRA